MENPEQKWPPGINVSLKRVCLSKSETRILLKIASTGQLLLHLYIVDMIFVDGFLKKEHA